MLEGIFGNARQEKVIKAAPILFLSTHRTSTPVNRRDSLFRRRALNYHSAFFSMQDIGIDASLDNFRGEIDSL